MNLRAKYPLSSFTSEAEHVRTDNRSDTHRPTWERKCAENYNK